MIKIAIDAMGGDGGALVCLKGADEAALRYPDLHFILFGNEDVVRPILEKLPRLSKVSEFVHAPDAISSDMKPSQAIRMSKNSSMRLAIEAVEQGVADAVVSAGNTGAYMALSKLILKTLPGIDRPALASFMPTVKGESVMLDLGANAECDVRNLCQFAFMGSIYAQHVLGLGSPKVGLLNIGSEEIKGNATVKAAADVLRSMDHAINFYGFVEGYDITSGVVDVIVTDGFTGNVALKTLEGTAKLIASFMKDVFSASFLTKLGYFVVSPIFRRLKERMSPSNYNGASFLGLAKVAVKSHGTVDVVGFASAISVARDVIKHNYIETLQKQLSSIEEAIALKMERE